MSVLADPLEAKIARAVRECASARIPIETLWGVAFEADSSFAGAADARARLLAAILAAEIRGLCRTPSGQEHWEKLPSPALPRWVQKSAASRTTRVAPAPVTWHSRLGWAASGYESGGWTAAEIRLLRAVNDFLVSGGPQQVVPFAERSLQLLGDEKALQQLSRGRLFAPGRLSSEMIGAVRTPPPFVWKRLGDGPTLLVIENSATYWTFCRLPRRPDCPIGLLAFGAGNHFSAAVEYIAELPEIAGHPGINAIRYFGDLDEEGLEIPRRAGEIARLASFPDVEPAVGLYAMLLRDGIRQKSRLVARDRAAEVASWLPLSLAQCAADLLVGGWRVPQESVGTDRLSRDLEWSSPGFLDDLGASLA